ncbi:MAG: rhamnulokinase [Solirubrobacteraceae bacterium]|nr:rhamnulokinase [Solirubrobacteraceae bacterium]
MPEARAYAAVDLGASSGRVVTGRLEDGRVVLEECHRFPNRPVRLPDGLRWNLLHLFTESLEGLRRAGPLAGVGVDTWGVDYALLDERGRVLGLPFHYRDARTDGMIGRAFERVPAEDLYAATGIQTMPINTIFQLMAEERSAALADAHGIALVPDLLAMWLCGELANERTNASTTGLMDARTGEWSRELLERLGIPGRAFGELVDPGTELGPLLAHHELGDAPVYTVASHDTASAYVAAPLRDANAAILSSGTWSLLGLELPGPVLSDAAREANLTNERGVEGTIRLLKNVMGLWLEQECARVYGLSFPELQRMAAEAPADVPLFDPDDDGFLAPGDMPGLIAAACRRSGQREPAGQGEVMRSIMVSLACKYRLVLERLEAVTGREVSCLHVIGGGAQNALLCRLTADITGRDVLAGPIEATALGNILVQMMAAGEIGSLAQAREVAAASTEPILDRPSADRDGADATYRRFLDVTGLGAVAAA